MTAPLPSPCTSPIAGLFNDLVVWLNDRLAAYSVELEAEVAIATAENQRLTANRIHGGTA